MKKDRVLIDESNFPPLHIKRAVEMGLQKRWLFKTWGGLGDVVCAEPIIRFCFETFKDHEFIIETPYPDLFAHIPIKCVPYNSIRNADEQYYVIETVKQLDNVSWYYQNHLLMNSVDYIALTALRMQLPIANRSIRMPDYPNEHILGPRSIIIHAGKHWPSKTFPSSYWNQILRNFIEADYQPVLIGKTMTADQGYVDTMTDGCLDLRDKLNLKQLVGLLLNCNTVLTNDSAPLHIAAAGKALIFFIATVKHEDYLFHWRDGVYGKNMFALNKTNMNAFINLSPVQHTECDIVLEECSQEIMSRMLPDPDDIVKSIVAKAKP